VICPSGKIRLKGFNKMPLCSSVANLRDDAFEADLSDQLGRVGVELDWFGLIGVRYARQRPNSASQPNDAMCQTRKSRA
jgi:hypothetical protein